MNRRKLCAFLLVSTVPAVVAGCRDYDAENGELGSSSREIRIHRMGGGIDVPNAPHGASLTTMGGGIHVGQVASFATVKTMGGGVRIDHATGPIDATTMGGSIDVGTAEGPVKAESMGGGISVHVAGTTNQERDIHLISKGGTVELTVPKDFPMDVRIRLAYTKTDRKYRIIQNAGLDVRESGEVDHSELMPRKLIQARGVVGSGLNRVTIETVNGDVILKQE